MAYRKYWWVKPLYVSAAVLLFIEHSALWFNIGPSFNDGVSAFLRYEAGLLRFPGAILYYLFWLFLIIAPALYLFLATPLMLKKADEEEERLLGKEPPH